MRLAEVEAWALRIIDGVRSGVRQEDTRVELKGEWIADRQKVARQLAGSCNAARGSEVLWLFGVDEVRGVLGCAPEDFASWWQGVTAEFAGVAPTPTEVVVHDGGLTFMAVLFSTVRSPFLIKNPQHGTRGGGPIQREVPWREGTSTRTATREDLLRLLDPSMPTPHVEVVRGRMTVRANNQPDAAGERQGYHWFLALTSYVTSPVGVAVVLPEHRCQARSRSKASTSRWTPRQNCRQRGAPTAGSSAPGGRSRSKRASFNAATRRSLSWVPGSYLLRPTSTRASLAHRQTSLCSIAPTYVWRYGRPAVTEVLLWASPSTAFRPS